MKKIILDTDIGPDCDDAAALAMLNLYADEGLCEILAVGHCTSNPYGAGAIDAINIYYGRPNIPIGTFKGEGFLTEEGHMSYNKYLTETMPNRYKECQPEDVVDVYRRVLAEQEDNSVEMIAIGPLNNLSNLLLSTADNYSNLNGIELVEKKISKLTIMGGLIGDNIIDELRESAMSMIHHDLSEAKEFNIVCDVEASINVAGNWPTPMDYLTFESGVMKTGKPLQTEVPEDHPVRIAYDRYPGAKEGDRCSWDLVTVESAVVPNCSHYTYSKEGKITVTEEGVTRYTSDCDKGHRYVKIAEPVKKIVDDINRLLVTMPRR